MFRSLLAFLRLALARAHGGLAAAYGFLHDAFDEAVEPFTRRLPWLRDRAVDAGHGLAFGTLAAAQVPGAILRDLDLRRPIYRKTAAYGHFGRTGADGEFPWERTDRVDDVKSALGL